MLERTYDVANTVRKSGVRYPRAVADEALAIGDLVYKTTTGWAKADRNGSGTYPCAGVVTKGAAQGAYPEVCKSAVIAGYSSLTVGAIQFLSGTAGERTSTRTSTTGECCQAVGVAVTDKIIAFDINLSYFLWVLNT